MTRARFLCESCREFHVLAGVVEVRPATWMCNRCYSRPPMADDAAQRMRDIDRDRQINALRGTPIDNDTRRLLGTWRLTHGSAA